MSWKMVRYQYPGHALMTGIWMMQVMIASPRSV